MKRAFKEIETDIGNKNIQEESNLKLLRLGSTDIIIECDVVETPLTYVCGVSAPKPNIKFGGLLRIIKGEDVVTVSKLDFHKKPRYYIKEVIV